MNKFRKIQAFTMGELLVVMVISSIVVTVAFMALSNVQKQVRLVNKTFSLQQEILYLERMLVEDLHKHNGNFDSLRNTIVFSQKKDTIKYQFGSNNIIRGKDTLEMSKNQLVLYLEGEVVTTGSFDAIEFSFADTYNQQGFFISKKKDAAYYVNQ